MGSSQENWASEQEEAFCIKQKRVLSFLHGLHKSYASPDFSSQQIILLSPIIILWFFYFFFNHRSWPSGWVHFKMMVEFFIKTESLSLCNCQDQLDDPLIKHVRTLVKSGRTAHADWLWMAFPLGSVCSMGVQYFHCEKHVIKIFLLLSVLRHAGFLSLHESRICGAVSNSWWLAHAGLWND